MPAVLSLADFAAACHSKAKKISPNITGGSMTVVPASVLTVQGSLQTKNNYPCTTTIITTPKAAK